MKKLFLYYSLTGNGDLVASCFQEHGYDIRKVVEKAKTPKVFFFRILVGGFRAGLKMKGKLVNYNNDVSEYDEIIIGSPVWNGRFPPAINAVLKQTDFLGKTVAFLFYSGSGDQPKVEKDIKKQFPHSTILVIKEPKNHKEELKKIVF